MVSTYVLSRNRVTNDVEIFNAQGVLLFKWSLTGNYGRNFTIYALTKVLGAAHTKAVVVLDETIRVDIPDEKFGFYRPPSYGPVKASPFARFMRFITGKE